MNVKMLEKKNALRKMMIIAVCVFCSTFSLYAQKNISGTVTDVNDEPVSGVSVAVKGTSTGTVTDMQGTYRLNVPENAVLVFSYMGYVTQEVTVTDQTTIPVTLQSDSQNLEEVVVVGYGTQKKVNLTGAVNTVKAERITNKPVTSLVSALTGEASGVTITQRTGQPGASQGDIRIRGIGTWGNAAPLILVDGISMSIHDVIPGDVESVSVLKDAASASIYGSRAANGVILITTKQGEKGKIQINYDGNVAVQKATRIPELADSWQYCDFFNQAQINEGKNPLYPQDKIDRMRAGNGDPDKQEANTNWTKELQDPAAMQQMHQISATGGTDKVQYIGTLGYTSQEGILRYSLYKRYNARLNTKAQLTPWFNLGFNLAYLNGHQKAPTASTQIETTARPYLPVKYSDGTWSHHSGTNPLRKISDDYGARNTLNNTITTLISPEITPIKGLLLKGTLGYESNTTLQKTFDKIVEYDAFGDVQAAVVQVPRNKQTDRWSMSRNLTANAMATYEFEVGANSFKLMTGGSLESFKYAYTQASRMDFPNNDFSEINAGDANTAAAEGNSTLSALASLFGRLNYVYADRYLFEANFRYDGSSKFARENRFGFFPSFSAGWRISEEAFFEELKTYIPNLKIRGSWGKLGNQQINDYQYLSTFGASGSYLFDHTINTGYAETVMGNPIITWETAENFNIGVDFSLFNNRLQTVFEWYKKTTNDILLNLSTPVTLGISPAVQNAGSVENKGWDISITWNDRIGESFRYHVGLNLWDVRNKITDLRGYKSPTGNLTTRIEGEPIDALFGYENLGICQNKEQYEKYKDVMHTFNANWNIGDLIIHDRTGDGRISADDKIVMGNQIPRYCFGINIGFDYKGFDFSCFLQGVGKADGYLNRDIAKPLGGRTLFKDHAGNIFDPNNPDPDAYYPRILDSWQDAISYNSYQSHWVQDASYIRLKNLQAGYTFRFPKTGIDKLRLMFSGENMLTFTKFRLWDPESSAGAADIYPLVAVYSFGVNITF
jgi:TonB-linked SusC/RagA family outer membrane protein